MAAELTSYGGLAAFMGISSGTIGTLVMALNNIKFELQTDKFKMQVDTQKRLIHTNGNIEEVKEWIGEKTSIHRTEVWENDKIDGKFKEDDFMELFTKEGLECVRMSYGNAELLDLHLT